MKKFDLLGVLSNGALAFLLGFAGIGCVASGLQLPVSWLMLVIACLFWAFFPQVALLLKRTWLYMLGAMVLWGLFFWQADIKDHAIALVNQLFYIYDGTAGMFGGEDVGTVCTQAVAAFAAICTLLISASLAGGQSGVALTMATMQLGLCLILEDTHPATGWILAVVLGMALVEISRYVRSYNPQRAGRLVAFLLIPVLLATCLLFADNPRSGFDSDPRPEKFRNTMLQLLDKLPLLEEDNGQLSVNMNDVPSFGTLPDINDLLPTQTIPFDPNMSGLPTMTMTMDMTMTLSPDLMDLFSQTVALGAAGPRNPDSSAVLSLATIYRGTLYLRERGYDLYTGTTWNRTEGSQVLEMERQYLTTKETVTIRTNAGSSYYFVPYYTMVNPYELPGGVYENIAQTKTYSFGAYLLRKDWQSYWRENHAVTIDQIDVHSEYLQLPETTQLQAWEILEGLGITADTDVLTAALAIQNYVRTSATYDLNTPAMPKDANDFAIWFLTESDTGYCVHFASAATVLLRAAGIPARYVEGYMASVTSENTKVTGDQAHAWVEYYLPGAGWLVMEATPGGGSNPVPDVTIPDTVPTEPTEPTAPPTEPTTAPTQPTTAPTEPTTAPTTAPTKPATVPPIPSVPTVPTVPTTVPTVPTEPTEPSMPMTTAPTEPETTASAPIATAPQDPTDPPEQPDREKWTILALVFALLAVACGIVGQWQLRLWLRQYWLHYGDPSRQAIALWRESQRMAALRRQDAPTTLRDLAWKAKYSQHPITDADLEAFEGYLQRSVEHLKQSRWYWRIIHRLIFAIY